MAFAKVSVYVPELVQHVSGLSSSAPLILPLGLRCHYACTFYALICIRISLKLYFFDLFPWVSVYAWIFEGSVNIKQE